MVELDISSPAPHLKPETALKPRVRAAAVGTFALSGAACFVIGTALLWVATSVWHWHYLVSTFVVSLFTNALGFALNRRWTFADRATRFWRELGRYYLVNLGSMALNLSLMALCVDGLRVPYLAASMGLSLLLAAGNFVLHRNWSFGAR